MRREGCATDYRSAHASVHPLLGHSGALRCVSNRFLRVLALKNLLPCALHQVTLVSFSAPTCGDSRPELHGLTTIVRQVRAKRGKRRWHGPVFGNVPDGMAPSRAFRLAKRRSSRPKDQQPDREHNGEEDEATSKHNEKPVVP